MSAVKNLVKQSFRAVGLEVQRATTPAGGALESAPKSEASNDVLPDIAQSPGLQQLAASRIAAGEGPIVLLGGAAEVAPLQGALGTGGREASHVAWDWDGEIDLPPVAQIVIAKMPLDDRQWRAVKRLKERYGSRVTGIQELVLPFTVIQFAQRVIGYHIKSVDEIAPYYLGKAWFGPFEQLNELFPLAGKSVIEFGPFDGKQTAGLVHSGVRELTCVEARAENFTKTLIARETLGWRHVNLVMDDFHNADGVKYGRFDLAFAHGVYYHSTAPLVFLENLVSLSDNVFVGGFVLKDDDAHETLGRDGETYRVQKYEEQANLFSAGVNPHSYYFHPEDLTDFFRRRGYRVDVMSDEESDYGSKRFYRFLARR